MGILTVGNEFADFRPGYLAHVDAADYYDFKIFCFNSGVEQTSLGVAY